MAEVRWLSAIEPTEAMVVIDVNTGKYEGKKKLEETVLKINLEAAEIVKMEVASAQPFWYYYGGFY